MSGFDAFPHDAWPTLAEAIARPWPEAGAAHDLRWHAAEHGLRGIPLPSVRDLSERWGWSKSAVHILTRSESAWRIDGPGWTEVRASSGLPLFDGDFEDPGLLTHAEVVERAVRWLRGAHKCDVVFAEMVTALPVSPDAIGWRCFNSGWSVLVEAKVSRNDFRADRRKPIHAEPDNHPGQERWYLTPPGLVRAHEVPDGWGLAECGKRSVRVVVPSPRKVEDEMGCWTPLIAGRARADSRMLLAAIQRHQLGVEWKAEVARFAAYGSPTVGEAK